MLYCERSGNDPRAEKGKFFMIKSNIFLDDGTKRVTKRNRNYFFAATLGIVFVNFYLYFFPVIGPSLADARPDWDTFSVVNLFEAFLAAYTHAGFQHCSLNMLCFLIAGAYLERKQGTFRFLSFVAVLSFFSGFATATNYLSLKFVGFSGVNYALYAYIFIDYIFVLARRQKRDLVNVIAGAVLLALIYFAMCFSGGTERISFEPYPYDLLHNLGHASGFFVGILFGLYEGIADVLRQPERRSAADRTTDTPDADATNMKKDDKDGR